MKQLYIIEYESAHWCGGVSHCVAWAESEEEAQDAAEEHMETEMRELFSDQIEEEIEENGEEFDSEPMSTVNWVKPLVGSDHEEYYADENQRNNFYPCVN